MFVIQMQNGSYVLKGDGWNHFVPRAEDATRFATKDAAQAARPGHHRDMGGSGFKGTVVSYATARRSDEALQSWRKRS